MIRDRMYHVYFDLSTKTYTYRTWWLDGSLLSRKGGFDNYKDAKEAALKVLN